MARNACYRPPSALLERDDEAVFRDADLRAPPLDFFAELREDELFFALMLRDDEPRDAVFFALLRPLVFALDRVLDFFADDFFAPDFLLAVLRAPPDDFVPAPLPLFLDVVPLAGILFSLDQVARVDNFTRIEQ